MVGQMALVLRRFLPCSLSELDLLSKQYSLTLPPQAHRSSFGPSPRTARRRPVATGPGFLAPQ